MIVWRAYPNICTTIEVDTFGTASNLFHEWSRTLHDSFMERYATKYFPKKYCGCFHFFFVIYKYNYSKRNNFPIFDAEVSANAATIIAVCVCEMLSDIGYFCLKVKTVVKKIGYFWAVPYLQRLPKHCDSLSHSSKITEICLMKLFSLAIFLE